VSASVRASSTFTRSSAPPFGRRTTRGTAGSGSRGASRRDAHAPISATKIRTRLIASTLAAAPPFDNHGSVAYRVRVLPVGTVYLVGAGPGDPGLLTVRGAACLARADVVVADYLVDPALLEQAPAAAERIVVGKHGTGRTMSQDEINLLLV